MRPIALLTTLLLGALPTPGAAAPGTPAELEARPAELELPRLALHPPGTAALAWGALVAWGVAVAVEANDPVRECRWCEPGSLDREARAALRWRDTRAAGEASDALLLAVPLGSAAVVAWLAAREGPAAEVVEDVLAVAMAVAVNAPVTALAKHGTGRLRPEPWEAGGPRVDGDLHSFFSGHTSRVFAAAAAAAQVARLRGRTGWRWLAAAGLAASAATAWLRVAADQHWATDVLGGAAAGGAVGLAVPVLMLRGRGRGPARLALAPAPGGLAILF